MPPQWIPNFDTTIDNLGNLENRSAERRVAEALKTELHRQMRQYSIRFVIQFPEITPPP